MNLVGIFKDILRISDCDFPVSFYTDKDGFVSITFNIKGLWINLEHINGWTLSGYCCYDDANTDTDCVIREYLGEHLDIIVDICNKIVFLGDKGHYVISEELA